MIRLNEKKAEEFRFGETKQNRVQTESWLAIAVEPSNSVLQVPLPGSLSRLGSLQATGGNTVPVHEESYCLT